MPRPGMQSSDSDSGEDVKHRALPIGALPKDFDPTKPATSAEEYLHHVMWEAKQCANVVTVKIDRHRIRQQSAVIRPNIKAVAPSSYLPLGATQDTLVKDFRRAVQQSEQLRATANRPAPPVKVPTSENPDHWCEFCYGTDFHRAILNKQGKAASDSSSKQSDKPPQPPLMSILLNLKQATLQNLMEWNVEWLQLAGFSEQQGKWLYCLLSCLEKPLIPELCDNVRQMVFLCARDRAKLKSSDDVLLPQLNLIITIITRYFNQDDLADPK